MLSLICSNCSFLDIETTEPFPLPLRVSMLIQVSSQSSIDETFLEVETDYTKFFFLENDRVAKLSAAEIP